ncbi:MAG: orotidine-5'-phosphate decarboxylase [Candidatus Omnitrophica bacterium]|nr:orotidine-5'-phosphate decarboxylase [Candidatus Omnitrophota bacterium]
MAELIVSLDTDDRKSAENLIEKLGTLVEYYKIGPIPLLAFGTQFIEYLSKTGKKVFLDLKFFDIPNTVEMAVYNSCKLNISMLTVHILGGKKMLKAAISGRNKSDSNTKIIGVTILTSFSQEEIEEAGMQGEIDSNILRLADIAFETGLDGIVCSAKELRLLRKKFPQSFLMVCPGIRPDGTSCDDQKRTSTVGQAIKDGADFLVVGRPIIESNNPGEVVRQIKKEIMENEYGKST